MNLGWSTIESFVVGLAVAILQTAIKNPQSVAKEKVVIKQLATLSTQADSAVGGGTWTFTPAA